MVICFECNKMILVYKEYEYVLKYYDIVCRICCVNLM